MQRQMRGEYSYELRERKYFEEALTYSKVNGFPFLGVRNITDKVGSQFAVTRRTLDSKLVASHSNSSSVACVIQLQTSELLLLGPSVEVAHRRERSRPRVASPFVCVRVCAGN